MINNYSRLKIKNVLVLLCIYFTMQIYGQNKNKETHLWEGNLALPVAQQPGSLIGLGQNIVDKNDIKPLVEYFNRKGEQERYQTIIPSLLYGINDYSSLFIRIPIATKLKEDNKHSSGIGDITTQYEYAYFTKRELTYKAEGTVLANIGFPTGSLHKDPYTGFGAISFHLGTTLNYRATDWYAFVSAGTTLPLSHHGNKIGNQYLYEWGFGKNIAYRSKKWLFSWIIEFDGRYEQRDKINKVIDQNSGGNTILNGYVLWFSTKNFTATGSISVPIVQHLFGQQNKTHYILELIFGWTFSG